MLFFSLPDISLTCDYITGTVTHVPFLEKVIIAWVPFHLELLWQLHL